jgi:hypothetical protein
VSQKYYLDTSKEKDWILTRVSKKYTIFSLYAVSSLRVVVYSTYMDSALLRLLLLLISARHIYYCVSWVVTLNLIVFIYKINYNYIRYINAITPSCTPSSTSYHTWDSMHIGHVGHSSWINHSHWYWPLSPRQWCSSDLENNLSLNFSGGYIAIIPRNNLWAGYVSIS